MVLDEFLIWLGAGGSIIAVSWMFEKFGWFQSLSSMAKRWIMFGMCVLIAGGAFAIQTFVPVEILALIAPWFKIVAGIFGALFISESFHKVNKAEM